MTIPVSLSVRSTSRIGYGPLKAESGVRFPDREMWFFLLEWGMDKSGGRNVSFAEALRLVSPGFCAVVQSDNF